MRTLINTFNIQSKQKGYALHYIKHAPFEEKVSIALQTSLILLLKVMHFRYAM